MQFYIKNHSCTRKPAPDGGVYLNCASCTLHLKKGLAALLDMAGQWLDSSILTDGASPEYASELLDTLIELERLGIARIKG